MVSYEVIARDDDSIDLKMDGRLVFPTTWIMWHYYLDNLIITVDPCDMEDGAYLLSDIVLGEILSDLRKLKLRSRVRDFKNFPLFLICAINHSKKWYGVQQSYEKKGIVSLILDDEALVVSDWTCGYCIGSQNRLTFKGTEYDEFAHNKDMLKVFGNKLHLNLKTLTPVYDCRIANA